MFEAGLQVLNFLPALLDLVQEQRDKEVITNRLGLAALVAGDEVWINLSNFLSHQAKLQKPRRVQLGFVPEAHRSQSENPVAGPPYIANVIFESSRRGRRPQLAAAVNENGDAG